MRRIGGESHHPINLGTGNKFQQEADFSANTPGPELAFRRFYNSQSTYNGPLGYGWTHNYNIFIEDQADRAIVWDADGKALYFKKEGGGNFTADPLVYDILTQEGGGTGDYVLTRKNNTIYRFDPQGRLLSIKDLNDNQITLTYNGNLLTSVSNNFGKGITFTHNQDNKIETVSDPEGNTIDYTYDSARRLTRVEDDLGNAIIYAYDSEGNKTREEIRDPGGVLKKYLDFQHDGENRLEKIINPDSTFTEFGYDDNGNRTSMKDPQGKYHDLRIRRAQPPHRRNPDNLHRGNLHNSYNLLL